MYQVCLVDNFFSTANADFLAHRQCKLGSVHWFMRNFCSAFHSRVFFMRRCKVQTNNLALRLLRCMFHCSGKCQRPGSLGHL